MRYDLNFWDEPDWTREQSLDPVFMLCAIASVLVVVGLGLVSMTYRQLKASEHELSTLKSQNQSVMPIAKETAQLKRKVDIWQEAVAVYDEMVHKNFVWSSQLEIIQQLVPEDILIEQLRIDTKRNGDTVGSKGIQKLPAWSATMTLAGLASGDNPPKAIDDFLESLENQELLSKIMVPNLASTAIDPGKGKRFRIDLNYSIR